MESNLIVWSLNKLKIGLWEDVRLPVGNTEVQNQWKYTLPAEFSSFRNDKSEKIDWNDYRACGTAYINFTSL